MSSLKDITEKNGIEMQETREMSIPTMQDAIEAGNSVLINEQAALLRECRIALDHLLRDKPMLAAKICGSTTLGNLRASLYDYRPSGVFGGVKND